MATIFDRYDSEFQNLTGQIRTNISQLDSNSSSGSSITSSLLKQADDLMKQMNIEARGSGDVTEKEKIATYKKSLQSLKNDFTDARGKLDRDDLFSGSDRQKLGDVQSKLNRQTDTLDNARRVMADTEDVAVEITEELGRNRDKIQSSRNKVLEVSGMTNQARRLVQSMSKRELQQRCMMYGLALVLIGAIVVVIYYMGKDKEAETTATTTEGE